MYITGLWEALSPAMGGKPDVDVGEYRDVRLPIRRHLIWLVFPSLSYNVPMMKEDGEGNVISGSG